MKSANTHVNDLAARDDYFGHDHVTVIQPKRGWQRINFRELLAYRELLFVLMARDLKVRYRQAVLGVIWAVTQPLLQMAIFSLLLGRLAKIPSEGYPYPVLVFSSIIAWTFFASLLNASSNSLTGSAHLISKIYFPRLIIPFTSIATASVDFLAGLLVLAILLIYYDISLTWNLLMVLPLLLAVMFCALGVGTFFAAMNASYRDFQHLLPLVVQVWFFATPVVYPASFTTSRWSWVLEINPMYSLIEGFRAAFLGRSFDWPDIGYGVAVSLVLFVLGLAVFERAERRFADVL